MTDLQYATDLVVLRFEGVDAARFLQGYLTCNTTLLAPEAWQVTALCNLQGRVVTSGWARGGANAIDLLVHASLATTALDFLAPYQRFSRTKSRMLEGATVSATSTGTNKHDCSQGRRFKQSGLQITDHEVVLFEWV